VTLFLACLAALVRSDVRWILVDEPDAHLDLSRRLVTGKMLDLLKQKGLGVLVVSHHPPCAKWDSIIRIEVPCQ
jgi:ABC-type cobalamin/Fe3+-siderophores transport system ATPase subunit